MPENFRDRYQIREKKWDNLLADFFPDARLMRWGEFHRVFKVSDRAVKIQWCGDGHDHGIHSLAYEYEILTRLEKWVWHLHPRVMTKKGWSILEMDWLYGDCLDDLIRSGRTEDVSLVKLLYCVFVMSLRGIYHKQFRARHIYVEPGKCPVFIDFGGSEKCSPWKAFWQNFKIFDWVDGKFSFRPISWIVKELIEQKLNLKKKRNELNQTEYNRAITRWKINAKTKQSRFEIVSQEIGATAQEGKMLACMEEHVQQAVRQDHQIYLDLYSLHIFPYGIYGYRDWGFLWNYIRQYVDFSGKSLIDLNGGLGLSSIFGCIEGADNAVCVDNSQAIMDASKKLCQIFGVEGIKYVLGNEEQCREYCNKSVLLISLSYRSDIFSDNFFSLLGNVGEIVCQVSIEKNQEFCERLRQLGFTIKHVLLPDFYGQAILYVCRLKPRNL